MIMIVRYFNSFINLYGLYLDYFTIFVIISRVHLPDIFRTMLNYNKGEIKLI
jgi:hypothetical protein